MALLTEKEVRARGKSAITRDQTLRKSFRDASEILRESVTAFSSTKKYDMFISHSIKDAEIVLGVKGVFEDLGYSVYVDWINDPQLDRGKVTPETAALIKQRMHSSKSLMYITTQNSDSSRWMPWECGYFDGYKGKVAIVPVMGSATDNFVGLEYLGLYPYAVKQKDKAQKERLWIHKNKFNYTSFDVWVKTEASLIEWRT